MLKRNLERALILCAVLVIHSTALAQKRDAFHVDYTVAVASVDEQLFHVTTDIKNINEPRVDLALPTWTPGWYTVENYFRNVLRFTVSDAKGNRIQPEMIRKQTWRIDTRGRSSIRIEFD